MNLVSGRVCIPFEFSLPFVPLREVVYNFIDIRQVYIYKRHSFVTSVRFHLRAKLNKLLSEAFSHSIS